MTPFKWKFGNLVTVILTAATVMIALKLYPELRPYTIFIVAAAISWTLVLLGMPFLFTKNRHIQKAYETLLQAQAGQQTPQSVPIETGMPRTVTGWRFRCDGEMHTIYDQAAAERWSRQGFDVVQVEVPIHLANRKGQQRR